MASWDDVRRLALALPETSERNSRGQAQWRVGGKLFVWERPLRKADVITLGSQAPDGEILAARVADLGAKDALIADDPAVYFTIPHFDNYLAILTLLDRIEVAELDELIVDAWLARAPAKLARTFSSAGVGYLSRWVWFRVGVWCGRYQTVTSAETVTDDETLPKTKPRLRRSGHRRLNQPSSN